jgi:phage terminase small subunit
MPRPRTPTATLEAAGSFIRHPERRAARALEPQPQASLGDAPAHLSEDEQAVWAEIASLFASGVATNQDRIAFELLACLISQFRNNRAGLKAGELSLLSSLLGRFGLTPSDRSRVCISRNSSKDALDEFLATRRH